MLSHPNKWEPWQLTGVHGACTPRWWPPWEPWLPPWQGIFFLVKMLPKKVGKTFQCTVLVHLTSVSTAASEAAIQLIRTCVRGVQDQMMLDIYNETWYLSSRAVHMNWYWYVLDKEIAWTTLFLISVRTKKAGDFSMNPSIPVGNG